VGALPDFTAFTATGAKAACGAWKSTFPEFGGSIEAPRLALRCHRRLRSPVDCPPPSRRHRPRTARLGRLRLPWPRHADLGVIFWYCAFRLRFFYCAPAAPAARATGVRKGFVIVSFRGPEGPRFHPKSQVQ